MLTENTATLQQASQFITTSSTIKPQAQLVFEQLLTCERVAKKNKIPYAFSDLVGTWQLCFITGTKKARRRGMGIFGSGLYLPPWITIKIIYSALESPLKTTEEMGFEPGQVENSVQLGPLKLTVSGPVKFIKHKILAFDFTQVQIHLGDRRIYQGKMGEGDDREQRFYTESIQKQAFFSYFLVEQGMIAARGRGGGLALWGKLQDF